MTNIVFFIPFCCICGCYWPFCHLLYFLPWWIKKFRCLFLCSSCCADNNCYSFVILLYSDFIMLFILPFLHIFFPVAFTFGEIKNFVIYFLPLCCPRVSIMKVVYLLFSLIVFLWNNIGSCPFLLYFYLTCNYVIVLQVAILFILCLCDEIEDFVIYSVFSS